MTEPFNSASRVYNILEKTRNIAADRHTTQAWAEIFEIQEDDGRERQYLVVDLLQALREEARLAQAAARYTSIRATNYENAFNGVKDALNLAYLTTSFDQVTQHIRPEVLSTLAILGDVLSAEGVPVNRDELQSLVAQLLELEKTTENTDLPEDIRRFFLSQIRVLLAAIRRYPIVGNKAFGEAIGQLIAARAQAQEAAQRAASDERAQDLWTEWTSILVLWFRFAEVTATVLTLVDYGHKYLTGS